MTLKEIMDQKTFLVLGDTENPEKYAFRIQAALKDAGYQVLAPGKGLKSLNSLEQDFDIIDLCIHPAKGLPLLMENRKPFRCIVIQPGAESPELLTWLDREGLPYVRGCLLKGLQQYPRN